LNPQLQFTRSQHSPHIYFDLKSGVIKIAGIANREENLSRFHVLETWVTLYCRVPNRTTRVDLEIEELNIVWKSRLLKLLRHLVSLHNENRTSLTIFGFLNTNAEIDDIDEIEEVLGFKIHRIKAA